MALGDARLSRLITPISSTRDIDGIIISRRKAAPVIIIRYRGVTARMRSTSFNPVARGH